MKIILTSLDSLVLSISATTLEFDTTDVKHKAPSEMRKSGAGESISKCSSEF